MLRSSCARHPEWCRCASKGDDWRIAHSAPASTGTGAAVCWNSPVRYMTRARLRLILPDEVCGKL
jgi:hypothetical protein